MVNLRTTKIWLFYFMRSPSTWSNWPALSSAAASLLVNDSLSVSLSFKVTCKVARFKAILLDNKIKVILLDNKIKVILLDNKFKVILLDNKFKVILLDNKI